MGSRQLGIWHPMHAGAIYFMSFLRGFFEVLSLMNIHTVAWLDGQNRVEKIGTQLIWWSRKFQSSPVGSPDFVHVIIETYTVPLSISTWCPCWRMYPDEIHGSIPQFIRLSFSPKTLKKWMMALQNPPLHCHEKRADLDCPSRGFFWMEIFGPKIWGEALWCVGSKFGRGKGLQRSQGTSDRVITSTMQKVADLGGWLWLVVEVQAGWCFCVFCFVLFFVFGRLPFDERRFLGGHRQMARNLINLWHWHWDHQHLRLTFSHLTFPNKASKRRLVSLVREFVLMVFVRSCWWMMMV